jgi:hypothetical protein
MTVRVRPAGQVRTLYRAFRTAIPDGLPSMGEMTGQEI